MVDGSNFVIIVITVLLSMFYYQSRIMKLCLNLARNWLSFIKYCSGL